MKQAMATAKEYDETRKTWAVTMYRSGVSSSEVEKQTGVKANYVRTLSKRLGDDVEGVEAVTVAPVSIAETPAPIVAGKAETPRFKLTTLDVIFYATTLTACAGIVTLLNWYGLPVALVYSLILWDAMETAKDPAAKKAAETGAGAVIVLEILAGCVHTYFFNHLVWLNYKSLPWDMSQKVVGGELIWPNSDKPGLVAACIAVVLSCAAVYAIHKSIITTRERVKTPTK